MRVTAPLTTSTKHEELKVRRKSRLKKLGAHMLSNNDATKTCPYLAQHSQKLFDESLKIVALSLSGRS